MMRLLAPRVLAYFGLCASVCGIAMLYLFDPASSALFPSCPFFSITGLHCPGCGTLRALHRLLHFRFIEAFAMNPLTLACLPFVTYGIGSAFMDAVFARPFWRIEWRPLWSWGVLLIVVGFGVLRNISIAPFQLLAPGGLLQ